jgi:hypothetical protein
MQIQKIVRHDTPNQNYEPIFMNIDQIKQQIEIHYGLPVFESQTPEEIQWLERTFNTLFGKPVFDVLVASWRDNKR